MLRSISNKDKIYRFFERIPGNVGNKNGKDYREELLALKKELDTYQKRLMKAQTLMLDGFLDQ